MKAFLWKLKRALARRRLELYKPYAKQRVFHNAGAKYRERLLRAGNQIGKTLAGGAEAAMHATGRYPEWWTGKRFDKPTLGWAGGVTGELTRDNVQRMLIGAVDDRGTGYIPPSDIIEAVSARGVPDLIDTIVVRHVSGGKSYIRLKYYEQGREKWQSASVDWVWLDEEPPMDIYLEALTRTNATRGIVWLTFTPLLGMSDVVHRFLMEPSLDRHDTNMTIDDAEHLTPAERQTIINSYPDHEREARTKGTPALGSGRIFPISEAKVKIPRFEIPGWYYKIGGLDFGWDHPTAAARLAYNPDADTIYVTNVYRRSEATPTIHASAVRAWGKEMPWAWPHDGLQHDKGSGDQLAEQYRKEGLNMLVDRATFEDGTNGVEAGVMEMLKRMENGTLKVFEELEEFFEEFRLYHRKEGKIVKKFDDIISAIRYGMMMLRFAMPDASKNIAVNLMHKSDWQYDARR